MQTSEPTPDPRPRLLGVRLDPALRERLDRMRGELCESATYGATRPGLSATARLALDRGIEALRREIGTARRGGRRG